MSDREQNKRENDALQSSQDDLAYGQDERDFGAGGQDELRALSPPDAPDRDPTRDASLPEGAEEEISP